MISLKKNREQMNPLAPPFCVWKNLGISTLALFLDFQPFLESGNTSENNTTPAGGSVFSSKIKHPPQVGLRFPSQTVTEG